MVEKPVVAIYREHGLLNDRDLGHVASVLKGEKFDVVHLQTVDDLLSQIANGIPVVNSTAKHIRYVVGDFTRVYVRGHPYDERAVARVANACAYSGIGFTACAALPRKVGNVEVLGREDHKGIVAKVENYLSMGSFRA